MIQIFGDLKIEYIGHGFSLWHMKRTDFLDIMLCVVIFFKFFLKQYGKKG